MKCTGKTVAGTPCGAYAVKGGNLCRRHSGGAQVDGAKGGKATGAKMRAIEAKLQELDLRSQEVQKKHLASWIADLIDQGESVANIARLYTILVQLTKEVDTTQTIVIERTIMPPGGRE